MISWKYRSAMYLFEFTGMMTVREYPGNDMALAEELSSTCTRLMSDIFFFSLG